MINNFSPNFTGTIKTHSGYKYNTQPELDKDYVLCIMNKLDKATPEDYINDPNNNTNVKCISNGMHEIGINSDGDIYVGNYNKRISYSIKKESAPELMGRLVEKFNEFYNDVIQSTFERYVKELTRDMSVRSSNSKTPEEAYVTDFACKWADLMEEDLKQEYISKEHAEGEKLTDRLPISAIADKNILRANVINPSDENLIAAAVEKLKDWQYGDELREWYENRTKK